MRVGNVFSHVCISVCLCPSFQAISFELLHIDFIFGMQAHLGHLGTYIGQVGVSRSFGQGHGHMRKMIILLISTC